MADPISTEKFLDSRIVKAFRHLTLTDLPDAPVHALKGLSERDGELLYESFYVKTVRDLADLKYIMWAQEIVALGKVPQAKIDMHAFKDKLIKKYEATPIKKLIQSPISVLQGVSAADKKRMDQAFNVKTVNDLARLKYAKWAQEICRESYNAMSAPLQSAAAADQGSVASAGERMNQWLRLVLLILLVAAILFAIYWFFRYRGKRHANPAQPAIDTSAVSEPLPGAPESETGSTDATQPGTNTQPGAVTDPSPQQATEPAGDAIQPGTEYSVQPGDTLYRLSRRAYGTERQWRKIYEANRGLISDPDLLLTGRALKIP